MRSQKSCSFLLVGFVLLVSLIMDTLAKKSVFIPHVSLKPPLLDQFGYKTTYACEGRMLNIVCDEGVINLIRANFGRFSISICNDHGNLDWRVNCMSYHSFPIMKERCSSKPNCSVNVSSTTFHDPCPGTRKYLEVQYHCGSDNWDAVVIQKPLLTTVSPTSSSTVKSVAGVSNTSTEEKSPLFTPPSLTKNTTLNAKLAPLPTTLKPTYTQQPQLPSTIKALIDKVTVAPIILTSALSTRKAPQTPLEVIPTSTKSTTTARTVIYTTDLYCASVLARGINWTWTRAGETAVLKCPEGASGFADWHCNLNPVQWTPEFPNLNHCRSLWLDNIKKRMDHGDSIISVTTELALMTLAKQLYSEDLKDIGRLIQQALYKGVSSMENVLDMRHRYNVLRELLQSLVQTLSNLIDNKQKSAWNDLTVSERKILISAFLEALKESALLLAETSGHDGSFGLVKNNVLLSLKVFGLKEDNIHFPVFEDIDSELNGIHWTGMQDRLTLPAQSLQAYSRHGTVKVIFAAYKNIHDFMEPGLNILHYSRNQADDNKTRIVNSKIIAASLLTTLRTENPRIYPPVLITLKHVNEENATNPICVFWDFDLRDWSAEGCWVELSNKSHTVCACDHLTNFAVVMELKDAKSFNPELEILHIIISSGCVVAVICLLITVMILSLLKITGDSIIIQKNMFFCLLVSETVFVAGIDQTKYHIACAIVAGVLQYFFLAAFSWMFFECYQQYTTFIGSSDPDKSHARFYYAAAYILPAVIVIISAIIDPTGYGTKQYCWLHLDNYFVFSFVGPAVAIVFGGIVFLSITICIFCHHSSIATAIKGKEEAKLVNIKSISRRTVMLIILVSFTWTSGLLYINKESVFLAYSFSALNCILGTSILAFYCLRNERVKQEYKEILTSCRIFSSCLQLNNKEEELHNRVVPGPNRTATTDHISQQVWNMAREKNTAQVKCTAQGHLSTMILKNPDGDAVSDSLKADEKIINEPWEHATYSQWRLSNPRSGDVVAQEHNAIGNSSVECHSSGLHHHSNYRQFLGGIESNSQFVDHIYETIDDDDDDEEEEELAAHESKSKKSHISQQQFPPAENYYGDHSDLSQHSSSSYGYDQRPLLIMGGPTRQANSSQVHIPSGEYSLSRGSKKKLHVSGEKYGCEENNSCLRDKLNLDTTIVKQSSCNMIPNSILPGMHNNLTKTFNSDVKGPSLPDLLQCPADSSVVFAVLEGDKVVSQLQQDDMQTQQPPKYKLSTYC